MKLNIGCGNVKKEDYVNIDSNEKCNPDRLRDIRRGLPYDDDTADEIYCAHLIEHLQPDDFIFFFNECNRVLKPHGKLTVKAPYFKEKWAYIDPTHVKLITEYSFNFFINRDYNSVAAGVTGWYSLKYMGLDEGGGEITAEFIKLTEEEMQKLQKEGKIDKSS